MKTKLIPKPEYDLFGLLGQLYSIESQQRQIGCIELNVDNDNLYIQNIYINPKFRNQGYAKDVLNSLFDKFKIKRISLNCSDDLIDFYRHLNFRLIKSINSDNYMEKCI